MSGNQLSGRNQNGTYKLNVDAAIKLGNPHFSTGMVLRDHTGAFVAGKTICKAMVSTVMEAESQAILEGLHWLLNWTMKEYILSQIPFLQFELCNSQRIIYWKLVSF